MINFNEIKEKVLPYFIKVYGEEYKYLIISRMNKIELLFYSKFDAKKNTMYYNQSLKKVELTLKFLEQNNIEIPNDVKNKIIKENTTYYLAEIPEANKLLSLCFNGREYNKNPYLGIKDIKTNPTNNEFDRRESTEILKRFGVNIKPDEFNNWIVSNEAVPILKRIEMFKSQINKLDQENDSFNNQYNSLRDSIDKSDKIKTNIYEKCMLEFLKTIYDNLSQNDKEQLNKYVNSKEEYWYSFQKSMEIFKLIGNSFYENGILESFSTKAQEKLKNPKTTKYIKNKIIENQMDYFKLIGVYNDQIPPQEFILTNTAISNSPNIEEVDKIISQKEHFAEMAENEYLTITSTYEDNVTKINSLGFETDTGFNIDIIKNGINCVLPQTKIINNVPESYGLIAFLEDDIPKNMDVFFIHELNHCIELCLLEHNNGKSIYKCGFEVIKDDEDEVRDYEQFSEIINHIIAMEITDLMHKDNIYIFDNPNISKIKGCTSYEHQQFIVEPLWKNYRKKIIESRVNQNLNSIFESIGRENFEHLNTLVNEYTKLPFYSLIGDLREKKTTDLTIKRDNIINETIETYQSISNYNKQTVNEESKNVVHK